MVMRKSRKASFNWSRRTKWRRTKRPRLKSLEFSSVTRMARKLDQTACFPGDTFSAVLLKTSREKSPCQDHSRAGHVCVLPWSLIFNPRPYPPASAVSPFLLSLSLVCPPFPGAIFPSALSPFSFLLCLTWSYCLLFMMTTFYNWYNPQFLTILCFRVRVNEESHWSWIFAAAFSYMKLNLPWC